MSLMTQSVFFYEHNTKCIVRNIKYAELSNACICNLQVRIMHKHIGSIINFLTKNTELCFEYHLFIIFTKNYKKYYSD